MEVLRREGRPLQGTAPPKQVATRPTRLQLRHDPVVRLQEGLRKGLSLLLSQEDILQKLESILSNNELRNNVKELSFLFDFPMPNNPSG